MSVVFADTSFYVGLISKRDVLHDKVLSFIGIFLGALTQPRSPGLFRSRVAVGRLRAAGAEALQRATLETRAARARDLRHGLTHLPLQLRRVGGDAGVD